MITELLLKLLENPDNLIKLKANASKYLKEQGIPEELCEKLMSKDIRTMRALVVNEARKDEAAIGISKEPYASTYTVSISGDTPHCPPTISAPATKGAIHDSFWKAQDPVDIWDSQGLTIVGTGIRAGLQTTPESLKCIEGAKKVLYLVADALSKKWIGRLNSNAESMQSFYRKGSYRLDIYNEVVKKILSDLREHGDICVVFYGHPGSFVYPAHEAIRLARQEGYKARMLPSVSAEANLFADLGIDAGVAGNQSYEATNFLLNGYKFDTCAGLILWQIGLCGNAYWDVEQVPNRKGLRVLVNYLKDSIGADHEVVLYEASELPMGNAVAKRLRLSDLPDAAISGVATLYVPPKQPPTLNVEMAKMLGVLERA